MYEKGVLIEKTNQFFVYQFSYIASQGIDGQTARNIITFLKQHPIQGCQFFLYGDIPILFPISQWFFLWFVLPLIVVLGYKVKSFFDYSFYVVILSVPYFIFTSFLVAQTFSCSITYFFHYQFLALLISFLLGSLAQLIKYFVYRKKQKQAEQSLMGKWSPKDDKMIPYSSMTVKKKN